MKFAGIEKEIEKQLIVYVDAHSENKAKDLILGVCVQDEWTKAVVTAFRNCGVNINDFVLNALEEWEYILNKMIDKLPLYVKENLKDYEIKESSEE